MTTSRELLPARHAPSRTFPQTPVVLGVSGPEIGPETQHDGGSAFAQHKKRTRPAGQLLVYRAATILNLVEADASVVTADASA